MATPMLLKVACIALMCMVLGTPPMANGALSCGQIQLVLAPCIGYLRSPIGGVPTVPCCNGLRSINNQSRATPDRQSACKCLKSTVLSIPGLNLGALSAIPAKCGINLPYKVTPSIDCNRIN